MGDNARSDASQISFPPELLQASQHAAKRAADQLRVEGFRHSWFSRLSELLIGKDKGMATQRGG